MPKGAMPVLVGVGQSVSQWDGSSGAEGAPSPHTLNVDAPKRRCATRGFPRQRSRSFCSPARMMIVYPKPRRPHGANLNYPGTLADAIGASPRELIYNVAGGQTAQQAVNEAAARIHTGEQTAFFWPALKPPKRQERRSAKASRSIGQAPAIRRQPIAALALT